MSHSDQSSLPKPKTASRMARLRLGALGALVGAFAVGAGLTAVALPRNPATMVALTPAPITAMKDWNPVAIKGQVSEIFGNKFIIQDDSGRALVETGRDGEDGKLVAKSETVTIQGRFEHGFVHALSVSHEDGRNDILGPPGAPPPHAPLSMRGFKDGFSRVFAHHPAPEA